jgi:hypothetical protein
MTIKLSNFELSLSSRLQSRGIFNALKSEIIDSKKIILDFDEIEIMTMSFGTELFDSINEYSDCEIEIVNANQFVNNVIDFCRSNLKQMAY